MAIQIRPHARRRFEERAISVEAVLAVLREPEESIAVKFGRRAAFKRIKDRPMVVIFAQAGSDVDVVTAYWADERRLKRLGFPRV